jgi:ABC-type multidrug transport system fused ATPase/permease subunit
MAKRRHRTDDKDIPKLNTQQSKEQAQFLLSFLRPYWWRIIFSLIILTASSGFSLLFPAIIGKLVDVVTNPLYQQFTLEEVIYALVTVLTIQSVVRYYTSTSLATITERTLGDLRSELFARIVRLPMRFFAERRVGELASRLSSDLQLIQETFTFTFLELLRQSIFLIGGIVFIASHSLKLTGMILLVVPVMVVIGITFARSIRKYSTQAQDALATAATIVEESLQAIASVKSFVNEQHETERYQQSIRTTVDVGIKGAKIRSAFVSFIIFAVFGGIAAVVWYGGSLVRQGIMTMGELTSFMIYVFFVAGALGSFAELFGQIQRTLGASVRVRELLVELPETPTAQAPVEPSRRFTSLELRDVSFTYPNTSVVTLNHVNCTIGNGQRVAFVGESGAGKSTTASLLQRFYEPSSGSIYFDGIDSQTLTLDEVRTNVGIVPQDIVLFGGTIAENIRYGKLSATDEELWEAARLANAAGFIEQFPDKLNTVVGERGIKLSGGQRQRIAIARAILKNPPILILDEATSSLDSETEFLIQQAMETLMQGRTTIIIAHRLSTIRRCDTIFVFHRGSIVETGTHDTLITQSNSIYARLCALQFGQDL